jgi:hypothetical protein
MREIKFRAWDKRCNVMVYFGLGEDNFTTVGVKTNDEYTLLLEDNPPIMQYTGLKDKNGKEAYHEDACQDDFTGLIWQVAWHEEKGCWYLMPLDDKMEPWGSLSIEMIGDFKIIGNTLENPELLEG